MGLSRENQSGIVGEKSPHPARNSFNLKLPLPSELKIITSDRVEKEYRGRSYTP